MNGRLVKEKAKCTDCREYAKVGGVKMIYAYYVHNEDKLCRNCAKKRGVI